MTTGVRRRDGRQLVAADDLDARLGVPAGTIDYGWALVTELVGEVGRWHGRALAPEPEAALGRLAAPLLLGDRPHPSPPLPVGPGHVHADVANDDDRATLAALADRVGDDPEALAGLAQTCRLPVTPYRAAAPTGTTSRGRDDSPRGPCGPGHRQRARPRPRRAPDECTVVDLSVLWAGPLATSLLAQAGARVVRIVPPHRPGADSAGALHASLAVGVETVVLDLRERGARARFEAELRRADLLVESFSRRVLPNLGYGPVAIRSINPGLAQLSIKAFDRGTPEQDWIAYGSGVHAASGLGLVGGRPCPAAYSYLDPLCGLRAATIAARLLAERRRGVVAESTLIGAAVALAGFRSRPASADRPALPPCSPAPSRSSPTAALWGAA